MNALDILKERGFFGQCSDEPGLKKLFSNEKVVFYIGFDATADSLHIGHLIPIMAMANLQRAGHIPIVLLGGGTTLIGDPSDRAKERPLLSNDEIRKNNEKLLVQFKKFLSFEGSKGMLLNNADWISNLKYVDFLREIGKHFRVNEMIKHEGYRVRLERKEGLSFLEFNYQLLQAYDFLTLFQKHHCRLQLGGSDQWGNILAGVDLVKKLEGEKVFAATLPLVEASGGRKMGKTEAGTVWLDQKRTSPYDLYQYWINTDDRDVIRFLKLFTFLPMTEINGLSKLRGKELKKAKEILAFEATKIAHGEEEARKAQTASTAAFTKEGGDSSELPTTFISKTEVSNGISILDFLMKVKAASSKSEAFRLVNQGGIYINKKRISKQDTLIKIDSFKDDTLLLRKGKKQYYRVVIK